MIRAFLVSLLTALCVQAQGTGFYLLDTFAGDHPFGDGGSATRALLDSPQGTVSGADGSLYIADSGHKRIRVVDPAGYIRTLVESYYALGIALDSQGNLYTASNTRMYRINPAGEATLFAGAGRFGFSGMAARRPRRNSDRPTTLWWRRMERSTSPTGGTAGFAA